MRQNGEHRLCRKLDIQFQRDASRLLPDDPESQVGIFELRNRFRQEKQLNGGPLSSIGSALGPKRSFVKPLALHNEAQVQGTASSLDNPPSRLVLTGSAVHMERLPRYAQ